MRIPPFPIERPEPAVERAPKGGLRVVSRQRALSAAQNPYVQAILFSALVIQIVSAVNAIGYWHPDQHFPIIEYATYKLGLTSADSMIWEFAARVRQTLQVHLFLAFFETLQPLHLDAYATLTVLRVITSLLNFALFNCILLRVFENSRRLTLYTLLIVANFSWTVPYIRTLFSSEIYGGLTYFSAIFLYQYFRAREMTLWKATAVGIVLSLAFFFRFQMGFAMIGLGVWLVFFEKASYRTLAGMSMGFAMGTAFNVFLDSTFYGALTFTPYPYWTVNVSDGRAMGLAPVWHYVGILSLALTAPPLSIALLPFVVRGLYRKIADPYSLSVFFFLLAHFVIPHKEPRFLFPIVGILPVILGYGVRDYLDRLPFRPKHAAWVVGVGAVVLVSLLVNTILLVTLLFVPVAQHVAFAKKLNDYFDGGAPVKLIFYQRTPYQTPVARNVATYYVLAQKPNIETRTIEDRSQFLNRVKKHKKGTYFVSTYDRLVRDNLVAEMDCIPLARSSELLLLVNPWWQERSGTVLPELWTLYDCEGARAKKPRGAHRQS